MILTNICLAITKPRNQIFLLIITLCTVFFLSIIKQNELTIFEEQPSLNPINPKIIKPWQGDPSIVKTGITFNNFSTFDMKNNVFVVDAIVWFEYDPAHVSTETIGKFSFEKGEIEKKSNPDSKIIDNFLLTQYQVRVKFSSNVNYRLFPLDQHRLYLSLLNTYIFPSDIMLISEKKSFSISSGMHLEEWYYINTHVDYGYEEIVLEKYEDRKIIRHPKVVYALDVCRLGIRQILFSFLPLFLIFFIALFSFIFDPKQHKSIILSLSLGSLSSIIGYRFVMQNLGPNVGYFILSDHVFIILLLFIFITFLFGLIVINLEEVPRSLIIIRGILLFSFHLIFLLIFYYLLFG